MKKYLSIIIAGFAFSAVQSQGVLDALRYANSGLNGTARFQAMSGAFGALGGDFTSINVNPAGSAIFSNNQVGLTLSSYNVKNKSDYFGTKSAANNNTFDLSQVGGVFVFNVNHYAEKSNWKKIVIAADYENTSNFDSSVFTFGTNPNHSVADYFLSYANPGIYPSGIPASFLQNAYYEELTIREQQAYLGYQSGIIKLDSNNSNADTYVSNVPAENYFQENYFESKGYNGVLAINAAAQYKDRFYFGLNLRSHFTDYEKTTDFYEDNDNTANSGVRSFYFQNYQHTYGDGFSFQLGAIAKITSSFRAGLSYESPTWFRLTDEIHQSMANDDNYVDSNYLLIYPSYRLQTPSKWTGSLAYVFGKSGLISIDYSLKDYGSTKYDDDDSYFRPINAAISSQMQVAGDLRIGAEYRIKQWSLRAGFRSDESPYKNKKTMGDLTGGSAGFGYNFGRVKLDLSYSYSQRKSQEGFFTQGFTDGPKITTQNNNGSMTCIFEL